MMAVSVNFLNYIISSLSLKMFFFCLVTRLRMCAFIHARWRGLGTAWWHWNLLSTPTGGEALRQWRPLAAPHGTQSWRPHYPVWSLRQLSTAEGSLINYLFLLSGLGQSDSYLFNFLSEFYGKTSWVRDFSSLISCARGKNSRSFI